MPLQLVDPIEPPDPQHSSLAAARLRRQLSREEAAERAGLSVEQAEWLEDGRLYRFPTGDDAVLATILYASALGIDRREARRMAGLRVPPRPLDWNASGRLTVALAAIIVLSVACLVLAAPKLGIGGGSADSQSAGPGGKKAPALLPPWKIKVDVLNCSGDIGYTRRVADDIGALGYTINRVGKAQNFNYRDTIVYYEPNGRALAVRLANRIGAQVRPLPGGKNPRRLVVAVGTPKIG